MGSNPLTSRSGHSPVEEEPHLLQGFSGSRRLRVRPAPGNLRGCLPCAEVTCSREFSAPTWEEDGPGLLFPRRTSTDPQVWSASDGAAERIRGAERCGSGVGWFQPRQAGGADFPNGRPQVWDRARPVRKKGVSPGPGFGVLPGHAACLFSQVEWEKEGGAAGDVEQDPICRHRFREHSSFGILHLRSNWDTIGAQGNPRVPPRPRIPRGSNRDWGRRDRPKCFSSFPGSR